ncbi:MAG: hypothetical protein RMJ38_03395 [candidate division WOR-3 bacterium]|nr:hypothetical protein [candidate division WOR-3 bacterium]MDW8150467.1 hypothetical protein [candidate division WOR-3 bacterium]
MNFIISQVFESAYPVFELRNVNPYGFFDRKANYIWFFKYNEYYIMEAYFKRNNELKKLVILLDRPSYLSIVNDYKKFSSENYFVHYLASQTLISYLFYSDFPSTIEIDQKLVNPLRTVFPLMWLGFSYAVQMRFSPISSSMVYASSYGAVSGYLKNFLVLDTYERIIWSMSENLLYFISTYYFKPRIPIITRSIFLTTLYYFNHYAFENSVFDLRSSINSSIISFSNLALFRNDIRTTNGDVFFEAISSISFGFSSYNLKNDFEYLVIGANLGYLLGLYMSQKNDIALSSSFASAIFTTIITYTISGIFSDIKRQVYIITPFILYANYFLIDRLFDF